MQFALPPRRSPHVLPGARSSRLPLHRRKQLKTIALFAFAALTVLYLLSYLRSSTSTSIATPAGTAGVVIVTLLDFERMSESYVDKIVANREDYAERHGKAAPQIAGSCWWKVTRLIVCLGRIHELLRKRLRLHRSHRRRSEKLGPDSSRSPCDGCIPSLGVLLPPKPACAHYKPDPLSQITSA